MMNRNLRMPHGLRCLAVGLGLFALAIVTHDIGRADKPAEPKEDYAGVVQPLVGKYCLSCHSTKVKKGDLDLERFASVEHIRKDLKPWQTVIEMLEAGEMPPKGKPQPTGDERKQMIAWTRTFLDAEARARAGDPGSVPLRRLSNAEYNATIRDLTGVDLQPAREFPADGAAGEGFTNAAESLADISPTLLNKYLAAAKGIADHAMLLPDGFRFSPTKTRRDWTDESMAQIRQIYGEITPDGRLPLRPYLSATVRHRDALTADPTSLPAVAAKEKLNAKFLQILWQALSDKTPSFPLDQFRTRWRTATERDVDSLVAEIQAWQGAVWQFVPIGSYRDRQTVRQIPNEPTAVETQTLKLKVKPVPGQSEVTLYLSASEFLPVGGKGSVAWSRPRFEGGNQPPLLLRDYPQVAGRYEIDLTTVFTNVPKYLAAAVEAANDPKTSFADLAKKHSIDPALLQRWIELLAVEPFIKGSSDQPQGKVIAATPLVLLDEKYPADAVKTVIGGWKKKGTDLPSFVTNASDKTEQIPGRIPAHKSAVHPTPTEFAGAVWKSPVDGKVRVRSLVTHAHPACGNGVAYWVEHRHGTKTVALAEGAVELGQVSQIPSSVITVAKGDLVMLAIDARDGNHVCDLTDIDLTISEIEKPGRIWDLSADVADTVRAANPHADRQGNRNVWSFVRGPAKPSGYFTASGPRIPVDSILARWREAASDQSKMAEAAKLAEQVRTLLTGTRPAKENSPDRNLYDGLVSSDSRLLQGLDLSKLGTARTGSPRYGLDQERFGRDSANIIASAGEVIAMRLPAALLRDREFVVEAKFEGSSDRVALFQVSSTPPKPIAAWDGQSKLVATADRSAFKTLLAGLAEFRRVLPPFICYPQIVPTDEVVSLKLFHREDEPLCRLFLSDEQKQRLDRLWEEHRFITQWPVTEHKNLPLFIGFVTQDQPKELVVFYEGLREPFRERAAAFEREWEAAAPKQLGQLVEFTARAFRRPLKDGEKTALKDLYSALRKKNLAHDEAFRTVLARVLVAPSFLFHLEQAPAGKEPRPVNDWELASRLSYFLWSTVPDEELRRVAESGRLHDPKVLIEQTQRMLKDDRTRALGIEFGTQMIHVRGFDELKEKNENLFPMFDENLRKAIYEESILFFQDLFQRDRSVLRLIDADDTFLNETLAKHYGIPGVAGPQFRRVDGVKKYGRGGILGLASMQTKEAGASRTSPILRGNWVVETMLGEKLPRPPANVPRLPEDERGNDGLTVRQLVQKHTQVPECAVCHVRIDPFGFALEKYDPIGRLREKDLGGLPIDTRVKIKDGTEFDGIDGLRNYLLTVKKDVVVRLFCRKLLGYALGRATTLSDQSLIDEMVGELNRNEGRISAAVFAIVRSPQFRMIRGSEFANEDHP